MTSLIKFYDQDLRVSIVPESKTFFYVRYTLLLGKYLVNRYYYVNKSLLLAPRTSLFNRQTCKGKLCLRLVTSQIPGRSLVLDLQKTTSFYTILYEH